MTTQRPPLKDATPPPPHWKRALEDEDEQPGTRERFQFPRLAPVFIGGAVALAGVLYGLRASGTEPVQVAQAPQSTVQTVFVPVYQPPAPQAVQPVRTAARPPPEPRPRASPCLTVEGWRICRP